MGIGASEDNEGKLHEALALLERALGLLDETSAPSQIGAYVDLGLCHLRAVIANGPALAAGCPAAGQWPAPDGPEHLG